MIKLRQTEGVGTTAVLNSGATTTTDKEFPIHATSTCSINEEVHQIDQDKCDQEL
jgi:hypothetical protein